MNSLPCSLFLVLLVAAPPSWCGVLWPGVADNLIAGTGISFQGPMYLPPARGGPSRKQPAATTSTTTTPVTEPPETTQASTATSKQQLHSKLQMPGAPAVSRCVWAIVSCCTPGSPAIRYGCFEQLGCDGAFWGTSPCEYGIARSALQVALEYYS